MRLITFIFTLFLFSYSPAGVIGPQLYHQYKNDKYCLELNREDAQRVMDCAGQSKLPPLTLFSYKMIRKMVYQKAAAIQIPAEKCFVGLSKFLLQKKQQGNKETLSPMQERWMKLLAKHWLIYKKSQLTLKLCEDYFLRDPKTELNPNVPYGLLADMKLEKAKKKLGIKSFNKVAKVCANDEAIALMKNKMLFHAALPLFSNEGIFRTMESHREHIIFKASGKSISDQDIMSSDLSQIKKLGLDLAPKSMNAIWKDLDKEIRKGIRGKSKFINKMEDVKVSGESGYLRNHGVPRYLHREGAIEQALKSLNLYQGDQASTAAVCVNAQFAENIPGELAEMVVLGLVGGRYFYTKATGAVKNKLKSAALGGSIVSFVPSMVKEINNQCFNRPPENKDSHQVIYEYINSVSTHSLTQIEYDYTELKLSKKAMKEIGCDQLDSYHLNNLEEISCLKTVLYEAGPLTLVLPMILSDFSQ